MIEVFDDLIVFKKNEGEQCSFAVVHWKLHKKSRHKRQLFSGSADCSAGNYNWMGLP